MTVKSMRTGICYVTNAYFNQNTHIRVFSAATRIKIREIILVGKSASIGAQGMIHLINTFHIVIVPINKLWLLDVLTSPLVLFASIGMQVQ